jgi:hypothetical protein
MSVSLLILKKSLLFSTAEVGLISRRNLIQLHIFHQMKKIYTILIGTSQNFIYSCSISFRTDPSHSKRISDTHPPCLLVFRVSFLLSARNAITYCRRPSLGKFDSRKNLIFSPVSYYLILC